MCVCAEVSWSPAPGAERGEVKLSISYKNDKLFIMVMHIRGLVSVWLCLCVYTVHHLLLNIFPPPDTPAAAFAGWLRPRPLCQAVPPARPPKDQQKENQGSPPHLQPYLQPDGKITITGILKAIDTELYK